MTRQHIEEAHRLRRERDALRKALKECAEELECEIEDRYPKQVRETYPDVKRRYDRDMQTVLRARVLTGDGERERSASGPGD